VTTGTYIIGMANFVFALVAAIPLKYFGRKPMLIYGNFGMAISLALVGLFIVMEEGLIMFIFMNYFISCF